MCASLKEDIGWKLKRRQTGVFPPLDLPGVDFRGNTSIPQGPLGFEEKETPEARLSAKDFLPNFTSLWRLKEFRWHSGEGSECVCCGKVGGHW